MITRDALAKTKRWVIKIGSALLTNDGQGLNTEAIGSWVAQIVQLRREGIEVVLVSSGSVAEGMKRLGWSKRPTELNQLQAAAAVGQMGLVQTYETKFADHGVHAAQILLTHDDLSNRNRYLNAAGTIHTLLAAGVVPVINENDTVVTDEIKFGDNDTLAALTANLIAADVLVILTDQQGLYDADPRQNPNAQLISEAKVSRKDIEAMASPEGGALGRGGMYTKVMAAKRAARSGTATLIASGRVPDVLTELFKGAQVGSMLIPDLEPMTARKQWIAGHLQQKGRLRLDAGAVKVLQTLGKSLLPIGVVSVSGQFMRGDMVVCEDTNGQEIARGLVSYSATEAQKIMGQSSQNIAAILGYTAGEALIHRDNLVVFD